MKQIDLPFDSGDKSQVRASIKRATNRAALLRNDLSGIMQTESGRRWMHNLLDTYCQPFRSPFTRDLAQMSFNCGESNVGLKLIADIHAVSPDLYLIMMKENTDGRTSSPGTDDDTGTDRASGDNDSPGEPSGD